MIIYLIINFLIICKSNHVVIGDDGRPHYVSNKDVDMFMMTDTFDLVGLIVCITIIIFWIFIGFLIVSFIVEKIMKKIKRKKHD